MALSNTFLASISRISQQCDNLRQVLEAMRHTMIQTIKLQNACMLCRGFTWRFVTEEAALTIGGKFVFEIMRKTARATSYNTGQNRK